MKFAPYPKEYKLRMLERAGERKELCKERDLLKFLLSV